MTKKKVVYPIHKMGKTCGYREYEDGSIKIAPYLRDRMDALMARRRSIEGLMESVTNHCQEMLVPINRQLIDLWDEIGEEYGFTVAPRSHTYRQGIVWENDDGTTPKEEG